MEEIISEKQNQRNCPIHSKFKLEFSTCCSPNEELRERAYYCLMCLVQQEIKTTSLISIEETLSSCKNQPITNWPLGIQKWQTEYLAKEDSVGKKDQIKMLLEQLYSELENKIILSLRTSQQKQLDLLDECTALETDLIEFYNDRFQRIELQNLFQTSNFKGTDHLKLLNSIEDGRDQNLQELDNKIRVIQSIENKFTENSQPKRILNLIEELVSRIDIFSTNLSIINENIQKQTQQQLQQEDTSHIDKLLEQLLNSKREEQSVLLENSFLQIKSSIQDFLKIIQETNNSEKTTEQSQKLLKLMDNIYDILKQFEIPNQNKIENEEEKEKNKCKILVQKTMNMYKMLTQSQKENLEQYFLSEKPLCKQNNYLLELINSIQKSTQKAEQNDQLWEDEQKKVVFSTGIENTNNKNCNQQQINNNHLNYHTDKKEIESNQLQTAGREEEEDEEEGSEEYDTFYNDIEFEYYKEIEFQEAKQRYREHQMKKILQEDKSPRVEQTIFLTAFPEVIGIDEFQIQNKEWMIAMSKRQYELLRKKLRTLYFYTREGYEIRRALEESKEREETEYLEEPFCPRGYYEIQRYIKNHFLCILPNHNIDN